MKRKFNIIDINKLSRDYIKEPLRYREKPTKNDIEYLYISINLFHKDVASYFNVNVRTLTNWIKIYNSKKPQKLKRFNINQTNIKHFGVKHSFQSKLFKEKRYITLRKNNNWGKSISRQEQQIYELLKSKYPTTQIQYISVKYPWRCDFYIPEIDTYIEYQGYWTHGGEPFTGRPKQLEKVKLWESKGTPLYKKAIVDWTQRDPLKRKTAKENNLKWLEFFNMDEFMKWYNLNT